MTRALDTLKASQEPRQESGIAMGTRRRMDRAAAVVLAVTGVVVLVFVAVVSVATLAYAASPRMPGDEGEHAVGETVLAVVFFLSPVVVGGLIALLAARMLWRDRRMGRPVAVVWVAVVGLACVLLAMVSGNVLHAARVVVFEAGMTSFRWPVLGVQPANFTDGPYYYHLDDFVFWMPGIGVVVALLLACLLLAGWVAERRQGADTA